jgi:hypothetical protein
MLGKCETVKNEDGGKFVVTVTANESDSGDSRE